MNIGSATVNNILSIINPRYYIEYNILTTNNMIN